MLLGFGVVCAGMVLGMVLVRIWDDASRAVAALPPEGTAAPARPVATAPAPPPAESAPPQADPAAGQPQQGAVTTEIRVIQPNYTVVPGDTLNSIARRHGSSLDALASINNLENRNSLSVGQRLIVP
ncbi:MAG: LysM peptidoglycan-binding domain-containing protein [Chloroflexi bacterium]|nr:LysM peptidoglycan-binding domain-containing protein [Chloroflexota bacterium]